MHVVLYGDLGHNFDAEKVVKQGREVSVVAVFAGMLVQLYKGLNYTLLYVLNQIIVSSFLCFPDLISLPCI